MRILLIEDENKIAKFIQKGLKEENFEVDVADNGEDGLYMLQHFAYDSAIIDWMLPKMSGLEIVKRIREQNSTLPILMLTAKGEIEDRVKGLESGADDYLSKPFSFEELVARIKALIRRSSYKNSSLSFQNLFLDPIKREVRCGDRRVDLTQKEFAILELLLINKSRTVTTTIIYEKIWDLQDIHQSNIVNVTIYHLRKKLQKVCKNAFIKTVRGAGYRIEE